MKYNSQLVIAAIAIFVTLDCSSSTVHAQRRGGGGFGGGGGARPSMGHVGGGGGRPSMGATPNISRPNFSRPSPSFGGGNRPSFGNVSRPSMPTTLPGTPSTRPSLPTRPNLPNNAGGPTTRPNLPSGPSTGGGFHPGGSNRPTTPTLPTTRPGTGQPPNRPSVKPPSNLIPSTRPTLPNRPTTLPGTIDGNRPSPGDLTRPTPDRPNLTRPGPEGPIAGRPERPTTLPGNIGNRPDTGIGNNRPSFGNIDRPTNRPSTLPGMAGSNRPQQRPVIGGDRVGNQINLGGDRTNISNRLGNTNINRSNINIGNTINVGNRGGNFATTLPAWDHGYSRPGWGIGGSGWAGNWHNHCINGHHRWYNGCWNHGYWGSNWYRPTAWVAVGWGLGRWTSPWGYGVAYYNPYYVAPVAVASAPYNYSQPVVVNNYVTADANSGDASPLLSPVLESEESLTTFDQGLGQFKSGAYSQALSTFDKALKELPNDPVVHEVRALTLFALGQYTPAAASLNSLLSSAPGMDWTTMSSLYGNVDDYSKQLSKLETFCEANKTDAAAYFVLSYHYLVVGEKEGAIGALQVVVQNQPKDATAKRMLDALVPPKAETLAAATQAGDANATTDLVGLWQAKVGSTTVNLKINEDSTFAWKATEAGQAPVELTGDLNTDNDAIVLVNEAQGSIAGIVRSQGPDKWQFLLDGAPIDDPGITFIRSGR